MAFSPSFSEFLLTWGMNVGLPVQPKNFYVSFHTSDPGMDGAHEVSGLTRTQHNDWTLGTNGDATVQNSGTGYTEAATSTFTVTHFSVWSAASGGDYYFGGPLTEIRMIGLGDQLVWTNGELKAAIS